QRLYGVPNASPYVKDGINDYIVTGAQGAVNPAQVGTKASVHYHPLIAPGQSITYRLRLTNLPPTEGQLGEEFETIFPARRQEADDFFAKRLGTCHSADAQNVQRQAFAGMLWSKQFYHFDVRTWLAGDPTGPPPPA
ncbi:MAG: glucosidase, partial [Nitrospira sp.]|nr:glucosidase [Nitrospira sp.]